MYYTQIALKIVVLLVGGDKTTQGKDIKSAIELATALRGTHGKEKGKSGGR